ncbi:aa3-type cytochrome oxidase subunit CtaJ [Amycolatopsis magusensis]|uniref:aa3-type cytochrome oxidase subunit CtaJ n=1 Tax=Amycolatopsis magusensis TaxID=882444 RepID=UPI0037AC7AD9
MNLVETLLVFAAAPLAIYLVVSLWTLRSKFAGAPRYRPGQPWEHAPIWWSANPEGTGRRAHAGADEAGDATGTARGGARGSW